MSTDSDSALSATVLTSSFCWAELICAFALSSSDLNYFFVLVNDSVRFFVQNRDATNERNDCATNFERLPVVPP